MSNGSECAFLPPEKRPLECLSRRNSFLILTAVILFHALLPFILKIVKQESHAVQTGSERKTVFLLNANEQFAPLFSGENAPDLFFHAPDSLGYGYFRLENPETLLIADRIYAARKIGRMEPYPARYPEFTVSENPHWTVLNVVPPKSATAAKTIPVPFWSDMNGHVLPIPFPVSESALKAFSPAIQPESVTVLKTPVPGSIPDGLPGFCTLVVSCGDPARDQEAMRIADGMDWSKLQTGRDGLIQAVWATPAKREGAK